jgi:hypothetical protein
MLHSLTPFRSRLLKGVTGAALAAGLAFGASPAHAHDPGMRIVAPVNNTSITGKVKFTAQSVNHTPTRVDFFVDGVKRWQEGRAPFSFNGDTGYLDTTKLSTGSHYLSVKGYFSLNRTATARVRVNVTRPTTTSPTPVTTSPTPVTTSPTPTDPGTVLWGSDFENSDASVYKTVRKEGSGLRGTHAVTTERARTGSRSMKMVLPPSTSSGTVGRYQLVTNMPNGVNGQDRWYGFSMYLGNDWNLNQIVDNRQYFLGMAGFRYTGTTANGPGSNIGGRESATGPVFSTGTNLAGTVGEFTAGRYLLGPVLSGRWIDVVTHVRWSTGGDGMRESWVNGVQMGRYDGATLGVASPFEHRMGIYQGTQVNQTRTLYWDNHRVGTSYAAVDPSR